MQLETRLIHQIQGCSGTGAISTPIYQTSTFVQDAPGVNRGYDYARSNNPTRAALENLIANLEGGHAGFAFGSGLAAVDAVVKLLSAGDHIVAVDDIYGGSYRSFTHIYEKFGIDVSYVDTTDANNVLAAIRPETKLVWLESPTNPTLKISDIDAISGIAHKAGALVVVDNTFASPVLQRPFEWGADIVIHSATKYLAGHSDVIAGLVVTKTPELSEQIKFIQNATGGILGPFDSWLTIRGIETAWLRVHKQSESALKIAEWISHHPEVAEVHYPGLKSHLNHEIAAKQQDGFGGIITISLKEDTIEAAERFVTSTQLFKLAESLGGVKSLLCHPASMTHKSTPREHRLKAGIRDSTIRLSVGIEDTFDLIADLGQTFVKLKTEESCLTEA